MTVGNQKFDEMGARCESPARFAFVSFARANSKALIAVFGVFTGSTRDAPR